MLVFEKRSRGLRDIAAALPARWSRLPVFERSGHGASHDEPEPKLALLRELVLEPPYLAQAILK
jgi:hypothetical protein